MKRTVRYAKETRFIEPANALANCAHEIAERWTNGKRNLTAQSCSR